MAKRDEPIFATEKRAAQLLDMAPADLRRLVAAGHLPGPRNIGGLERFDVAELAAVIRGEMIGGGAMQW
ncbi:hypothetical protein HYN69_10485 [Gemmobacter aquarius]|uniref:Helix-turn-helix domain-containing protein n=1 Tax=Paragemmobacter aquarius TaxID=2169400 RepID=A0A2S0UM79_9RHOB|nr:DNA-binding protein [Gemmobacter aquarius]AWB48870.1 hypothetical protein HYN69_10485 [Gemmobacter aquarius]